MIHCNLVASGVDWEEGLRLLRDLARSSPRCRRELEIVEAMAPGPPPAGEVVSEAPHIVLFRKLFTEAECRYLIEAATPMLAPSVVVDAATGRQRPDPVRISDGIGFTLPLENPAVHALNRRIAAASGTDVAQGEPLQVLRYRPGGEYKPHFDAIPGFANQRILTMIVWLNEGYEGGETMFAKTGAKFKGKTGDALLFRNALRGRDARSRCRPCRPAGDRRREADRQPLDPRAPVRAAAKRAGGVESRRAWRASPGRGRPGR